MSCVKCGKQVNSISSNYCSTCAGDYFQNCDMPLPKSFGIRYGWICPRCGKVYSPDTRSCDCSGDKGTITTGSTISVPDNIKISLTGTIIGTSSYETQFNKVDSTDISSVEGNYDPTITLRNDV